jgi:hypothetical protein
MPLIAATGMRDESIRPELAKKSPKLQSVTIRHLLKMKSGMKQANPIALYYGSNLKQHMKKSRYGIKPDSVFAYDNANTQLLGMIIEKATQSNISIHDELSRLTYYLELEKERFKNKFDYLIEIDPTIDTREVFIPNMIVQPHVENCIIHGILPKQTHGTLTISFSRQEPDVILIKIEDDGIGLIKAKEHVKTGHKSLGTSTIQNILEINSKLTGKKQKVSMTDKSTIDPNLHGTIITIELEL